MNQCTYSAFCSVKWPSGLTSSRDHIDDGSDSNVTFGGDLAFIDNKN